MNSLVNNIYTSFRILTNNTKNIFKTSYILSDYEKEFNNLIYEINIIAKTIELGYKEKETLLNRLKELENKLREMVTIIDCKIRTTVLMEIGKYRQLTETFDNLIDNSLINVNSMLLIVLSKIDKLKDFSTENKEDIFPKSIDNLLDNLLIKDIL